MGRYLYSPLVVEALLCIFLFFLPILEAGKEDTSHFHDGLDHNFPLDGSVEDEELVIEDGPNEATKEFRSNVHFDNTLTNGGVLDLDELSECIRAGQDKSTLERWMECIKSEGSHTMDSQGILPSSANEILSVDEEKGTEFSNLHEQIENDNREALGALDASLLLSGLQNSSAEFMDSTGTQLTKVSKNDEQEEQKIYPQTVEHHESEPDEFVGMIGSVINDNSVDTELPSLEEVEPEKLNSEDSKPRDPEMLFSEEAKCDVPNTEIPESGVPYKLRKLLQE